METQVPQGPDLRILGRLRLTLHMEKTSLIFEKGRIRHYELFIYAVGAESMEPCLQVAVELGVGQKCDIVASSHILVPNSSQPSDLKVGFRPRPVVEF